MSFSLELVKFHWFGINLHVSYQSECRNCCLYIIIQKIASQAESGKYFQIWFFPRFWGKKWRRSEHAHASYAGLFSPARVQPLYWAGLKESSGTGLKWLLPRPHGLQEVEGQRSFTTLPQSCWRQIQTVTAEHHAKPCVSSVSRLRGSFFTRNVSALKWSSPDCAILTTLCSQPFAD